MKEKFWLVGDGTKFFDGWGHMISPPQACFIEDVLRAHRFISWEGAAKFLSENGYKYGFSDDMSVYRYKASIKKQEAGK